MKRYLILDYIYGSILLSILTVAITIVIARVISSTKRKIKNNRNNTSISKEYQNPGEQCVDCFNLSNEGCCKKIGKVKIIDGVTVRITDKSKPYASYFNRQNDCKDWEDRNTFIICFLMAIDIVMWCLSYGVMNVILICSGGK